MSGEKHLKQKTVIAVCAVLFILTGARAANQPAAPIAIASYPLGFSGAFTASGERYSFRLIHFGPEHTFPDHSGCRTAWICRPLLLVKKVMLVGLGGVVRIENRSREPVAGLEIITCPGLPWGRRAILFVTHGG